MVLLNCTYVHMSLYKYILLSNLQPLPNIILIKIYLKYYPKDSSVVNLIECYSPWVLSLSFISFMHFWSLFPHLQVINPVSYPLLRML